MNRYLLAPVVTAVVALTGCSTQDLQRFVYDVGQQHACMQQNDGRLDEGIDDLACMNPAEREGMDYDQYRAARAGSGG